MAAYPTAKAVALTKQGVFYDNGKPTHPSTIDLGPNTDVAMVLAGAARAFSDGEGVLLVDMTVAELDLALTVADVTPDWRYTMVRTWTTFVRQTDGTVVHLGCIQDLFLGQGMRQQDLNAGPLLAGSEDNPQDMVWRLSRYHTLVGGPWRATAGVSGCAALRARHTHPGIGKQPLWHSAGPRGVRGAGPMIWTSPALGQLADAAEVHVFDVNAMYLAGMKNADLAWGSLDHCGAVGFDPARPGYWEVDLTRVADAVYDGQLRPPAFPAGHAHKGAVWVTTPMLKYVSDATGGPPDILDSWTSGNPQGICRGLAERLMSVRLGQLGPAGPAGPAIKRTYVETIGMMARPGGSIHRPDWASTIMDLARTNMMRRIDRAAEVLGSWPVAVRTDAVYWPGHDAVTIGAALGTGQAAGLFKYEQTSTVGKLRTILGRGAR